MNVWGDLHLILGGCLLNHYWGAIIVHLHAIVLKGQWLRNVVVAADNVTTNYLRLVDYRLRMMHLEIRWVLVGRI